MIEAMLTVKPDRRSVMTQQSVGGLGGAAWYVLPSDRQGVSAVLAVVVVAFCSITAAGVLSHPWIVAHTVRTAAAAVAAAAAAAAAVVAASIAVHPWIVLAC